MIRIAVLGYGTVGSGVVKVIQTNAKIIAKRAGQEVEVKYVLDLRDFPDDPIQSKVVHDFNVILEDPEVDIVVETMGGTKPAYEFVKKSLLAGKSVCTSNKELVAAYGAELVHIAKSKTVNFLFEASVGGGIPIIRPLNQSLTADRIEQINGILNGTTNYILTKMAQEGSDFADVLKEAQELGYAEKDPTADVEGLDAGRKVAILASAAFNSRVTFEDVYTEGITKITATDIEYAKEMGCTIKLLGVAKDTPEGIEARVHPMLIDSNHPLATVNDSYNAVFLTGDAVQDTMFYGRGAGELPTASAVVGDIFDVVRNILWNCCGRIGCTCYRECPIKRVGEIKSKYFVRMQIENRYGTLASVASVFGNNKVSIAQMLQKRVNGKYAEIVVITDEVKERHFEDAMQILGGMSMIQEISSTIRVY